VKEDVQLLIDLQELDQHILKGRSKQEEMRAEQKVLTLKAEKIKAVIDQLNTEIEAILQERSVINQSLLQEQDNIEKAEARLPEIKTQKEYLAVLKEVDIAKKQAKDQQDLLDSTDQALATLEEDQLEKQQELESLQAENDSRSSEINAELKKIDASLVSEDNKRARLVKQVPEPIRKKYELLLVRRKGLALVEASKCTCLGCNMHLPPQFFNTMLKKKGIASCPHCNRLLYVLPQEN
jgi:hypothetical protein